MKSLKIHRHYYHLSESTYEVFMTFEFSLGIKYLFSNHGESISIGIMNIAANTWKSLIYNPSSLVFMICLESVCVIFITLTIYL